MSSNLKNRFSGFQRCQQSEAASDITATMNTIQSITAQTRRANQTAQSIGNLAQLAANLRCSVADFKPPA